MSEKLKPCPFCGSSKISFHAFSICPDCFIICDKCKAKIEALVPWDDMTTEEHDQKCGKVLLKKWNRRSNHARNNN